MILRRVCHQTVMSNFFKLYAFILLTCVPGINYFAVTTHPLHQLQVRKRSSSSCYMIETYIIVFPVIEPCQVSNSGLSIGVFQPLTRVTVLAS